MAARKQSSSGSKPPPRPGQGSTPPAGARGKPRDEPKDDAIDAGWFDDEEASTTAMPSLTADGSAKKDAAKAASTKKPADKAPAKEPAKATGKTAPRAASKAGEQGAANAARLLPAGPRRRITGEVHLDWIEEEKGRARPSRTIPVQAEWLEIVEEEPTTTARGRTAPARPPPIPGPPPLPKETPAEKERSPRRPSGPPPRGKR